jgi:crotonobetainyl-CoA:carnitine CoA-transferase CaiB-like acyl-CoA transferase
VFTPLTGIRILELSRLIPGAAVTHYFADFGADVVKVEQPPVGDYIREVMPQTQGVSLQHLTLDRNKRSIALDLTTPEGQDVLHELVRTADAVVEVSRPGGLASRGADAETLLRVNPRLVYCSFTGFGQQSTYAHLPTHGSNLAAFAGVNGIETREDGVIVHAGLPYGRYRIPMEQAALQAAFALLAALRERDRTGTGRHLDLALVHALMAGDYAAMTDWANNERTHWVDLPQPTPRYGYYRCRDGEVLLVCPLEHRFWTQFCDLVGRPDLHDRGDWSSGRQMDFGAADIDLYREIQDTIATRDRQEWLDLLIPAGIPTSPVNDIASALADPDIGGRLFVDEAPLPDGTTARLIGPIVQDPPRSFRSRPAPGLGVDTDAVLQDYGVGHDAVRRARTAGALGDG